MNAHEKQAELVPALYLISGINDDNSFTPELLELLGDDAHIFSDNGGEPDGNAWMVWINDYSAPAELADRVVAGGYGEIVQVVTMTAAQIATEAGYELTEDDDAHAAAVEILEGDFCQVWTYYATTQEFLVLPR